MTLSAPRTGVGPWMSPRCPSCWGRRGRSGGPRGRGPQTSSPEPAAIPTALPLDRPRSCRGGRGVATLHQIAVQDGARRLGGVYHRALSPGDRVSTDHLDLPRLVRGPEGLYFERKSLFEGPDGQKRARDRRSVRDDIAEVTAA